MRAGRGRLVVGILAVGVTVGVAVRPPGVSAQAPTLDAVDSLTARGDVERARDLLTAWWEGSWAEAGRSERQRALWLRGRLTVDPTMARRDYARLAVEFPGGRYSARALHRLGLEAEATGDVLEAAARFEELASGYPSSPLRLDARGWLRDHREEIAEARRRAAAEPAPPREGPPPGRRDAPPPEPGEAAPVEPGEEEAAEAAPRAEEEPRREADAGRGRITVQLGAFSTEERARRFAGEVEAAGYRPRMVRVRGSELIRVRTGRFRDEAEARALGARLQDHGFDATIASDAHMEIPPS